MSFCLYHGRCLLLFLSSYIVVLVLCLVHLLIECGLWYSVHGHITQCSIPLFIHHHIWISLSCFFRSVISLSWPSFCSLLTFIRLYDAMIVSHVISWMHFLMFFLLCFWWSCIFLHTPFIVYHRFINIAYVDDDILELSGLLIALVTFDLLCWIISVMVLLWCLCCLVVSWIRVGIRSSFILFVKHRSTFYDLLVISFCSSLILLITILWSFQCWLV